MIREIEFFENFLPPYKIPDRVGKTYKGNVLSFLNVQSGSNLADKKMSDNEVTKSFGSDENYVRRNILPNKIFASMLCANACLLYTSPSPRDS